MADFKQKAIIHTPSSATIRNDHPSTTTIKDGDSASDRDGTTDEEPDQLDIYSDPELPGLLVDISISRTQTDMKSPYTPAIEKAKALEDSRSYFAIDLPDAATEDESPSPTPKQEVQPANAKREVNAPAPWKSQQYLETSSSNALSLFGAGLKETRKRAGSVPAAILESFRKMVADLPSYPTFGYNSRSASNDKLDTLRQQSANHDREPESNDLKSLASERSQTVYPTGLDGNVLSNEPSDARPKTLRRATSDNSLYLRRATTGASEFDDTNVYANVADMPNARFKAITDSLADSSFKRPKMPSITLGSGRNSASRMNTEATQRNTAFNTGNSRSSTLASYNETVFENPSATNGSSKKNPILSEALSGTTGDIVVMGGYRGSVLRSAEPPHHQLWVPVKVGLNLRKADLEVGLTREDEERSEEKIIPSGMLSHIGPIDLGRRFLKKVRKCPNSQMDKLKLHDYGYDWRLSPHLLSEKLIKFLESLDCNQPETPLENRGAILISHSLGGLITRHAVNRRPDLFAGVIYCGAPQNCCNILGPLRNGDDVLLSSKVLTAQVNFTFRTSYLLLPEDGRCFLNKTTGERYDVDFFDANSWDEHHLSPCINPALPPYSQPQRKSMIGSISESISAFTPSFSSKRSSWFSNSNQTTTETSNTNSTSSPTRDAITEKVSDAQDTLENATQAAADGMKSPKQEGQNSLEPSMKPSSSNKASNSVATNVTIPKDKAREFLTRTLAEVKQFKSELYHIQAHQDKNRYPPHAIIFGKSLPTVYGAKVACREAIKCADAYDDLAFAAGDGVVLASAAQLPSGYRCVKGGRVQSDRGHVGLLGDLEGIGQCIAAVVEGRRRGIGMGNYENASHWQGIKDKCVD